RWPVGALRVLLLNHEAQRRDHKWRSHRRAVGPATGLGAGTVARFLSHYGRPQRASGGELFSPPLACLRRPTQRLSRWAIRYISASPLVVRGRHRLGRWVLRKRR